MIPRTIPVLAALALLTFPAAAKPAKPPRPAAAKAEAPLTVESLLAQSRAAIARGDTALALRLAQSAMVADPAQTASYVALGDIYADTGQADYARSFYDAALGIDPSDAAALKAVAALDHTRSSTTANAAQ